MTEGHRPSHRGPPQARVYVGVAAVSAGVLAYEILLTRLLSIVQWHHFAFMIISVALLGFGASGTFLTFAGRRLARRFDTAFAANAGLFALASYACFALAQSLPLNLLEITWSPEQILWLALAYVLLMLPFFFAANCIALGFVRYPDAMARIYASDLAGAALGCGVVLWLLHLATPGAVLVPVAATGALAAVIVALDAPWPRRVASAALVVAAGSALYAPPLELRISQFKGLAQAARVAGATVAGTRSSPLGLLTVLENARVPFRHAPGLSVVPGAPVPDQVAVFTDADGATMINRFDGDLDKVAYLDRMTSALAYHLRRVDTVLVLGAGGGGDVLQALYHGAERIVAVELNEQVVDLVRGDYAEFAGDIYRDDRVMVVIAEARDFVAREGARYDLIQVPALDAFGGTASGLRALHESYLYTVDALQAYLGRLAPGGLLSITRWVDLPPRDGVKLFAAAVSSLRAGGVAEPGRRMVWMRGWSTATLVVKNGEFGAAEIDALRAFAAERQFDLAWYPGMTRGEANRYNVLAGPAFFDAASALLGDAPDRFVSSYKFRIAPSTDDRPFHFHFFSWRHFPEMMALRARGGMGLLELGYLVLIATLVQAVLVSVALIALPLAWMRREEGVEPGAWSRGRMFGYFLGIGLAFLFIEVAFIQIFVRFLGHPVYSVAVVLASFLLFAAAGSRLAEAFPGSVGDGRRLGIAVSAIAVIGGLYAVVLPEGLEPLSGAGLLVRGGVVVALVAPLAVAMGMPFPLGLRALRRSAPHRVPWAWAVNGCASVVSAVLAVVLAMHFGFTAVILTAATLYVLAALVGWRGAGSEAAPA